jgi:glutathione synthase/RimK-type ligase-like ATP-grasp enzyme
VLARSLRRRGLSVAHPVWDDPSADWDSFGITIVRSTWDYFHRRPAFLRWIRRAGRARNLWNPPEVLRQNTDKRYLADLARAGVPVVPTVWCRAGRSTDLRATMDQNGWSTVVVKPAVSGAGDRTLRVHRDRVENGQRHLSALVRTGHAMVQPYLESVARGGERSLIYLAGKYSHSVRRVPLFDRPPRARRETLTLASPEMRRIALAALEASPRPLLYARVDLVEDDQRAWRIMEVELTEPSLFFVPYPRAAQTFAAEIERKLRR